MCLGHSDGLPCVCDLIAKVRADERERAAEVDDVMRQQAVVWARVYMLADLRARVEALTTEYDSAVEDYVSRADVLALLGGDPE